MAEAFDPETLLVRVVELLNKVFDQLEAPTPSKLIQLRIEKAKLERYLQDTGRTG